MDGHLISGNCALAAMYGYDTAEQMISHMTAAQRYAWSEQRERKAAPQPELLARQVPPAKLVRKE